MRIESNRKVPRTNRLSLGVLDMYEVLVSYDVSSLFTNVPVDETIESITERAFENDWFNREHDLNITKSDLIELLRIATKNQLFQFEGKLYEQVDGVAMGSPLGPLMANAILGDPGAVNGGARKINKKLKTTFNRAFKIELFSKYLATAFCE